MVDWIGSVWNVPVTALRCQICDAKHILFRSSNSDMLLHSRCASSGVWEGAGGGVYVWSAMLSGSFLLCCCG